MLVSHRADTQETDVENLSTIWHPTRDFLAVSNYKSNDGGDGGKSFFKSKKKAAARPAVISWHNREPILAIGWDNGKLTIVDPVKGHEEDIPLGAEIEEICGMHWNSESGTLLVADLVNP
uniref:Anaphase-promoting complex subunit 4 WD40 domain-containing protein n=1 Tax=Panagrolaimus davidi TaxID=227884 RepID=A0A914QF98_9BILA